MIHQYLKTFCAKFLHFYRKVLTAAHCVCIFYEAEKDPQRSTRNCLLNPPGDVVNQQSGENVGNLNFLEFRVNSMDRLKGQKVDVWKAYVMRTAIDNKNHVILGGQYDIGLIVPHDSCVPYYHKYNLNRLHLPPR